MKWARAVMMLSFLWGFSGLAQTGAASKVALPMIVSDSHQRLVKGLTPALLIISEGKKRINELSVVRGSDIPLELGLLIDTSSSENESGNFNEFVAETRNFLREVIQGPADRAFVATFANKIQMTGWLRKEPRMVFRSTQKRLEGPPSMILWSRRVENEWAARGTGTIRRAVCLSSLATETIL